MDDGAEYLYKEPKVTSLAEFSMRLKTMYGKRFGADVVNIIQSSNKVGRINNSILLCTLVY